MRIQDHYFIAGYPEIGSCKRGASENPNKWPKLLPITFASAPEMFSVPCRAAILRNMNDPQSRFVFGLVAIALFSSYALPMIKQAKLDGDAAIGQTGQVYVAPSPNDPNAPSGYVSVDELQQYAAKRAAAERKAAGLR